MGSLPRAWRRVGVPTRCVGAKKNCEIGVGFSFAALSVFRLRRAEAASAVWIPHWHSEPFESQETRAAKRSSLVSPGLFSITLSDGYSNSGKLLNGSIRLY